VLLADFIRDGAARLEKLYPSPEARGLVLMLCRELLGVTNYTHVVEPKTAVPADRLPELEADLERLCAGEPIQYVLGVAEFCDRRFAVGPGVLVPRPETELLVAEAVRTLQEMELDRAPQVLDLCTGSGCIAWSIALDVRDAEVIGVDLSETALGYARGQFEPSSAGPSSSFAGLTGESPSFIHADVLDTEQAFPYGPFDLIVSNPPYVLERERAQMRPNVLDWEPALALFVPDDDPLRFYRAVARWAQRFLRPGGVGLVEINEALGPETAEVFRNAGFKNVQNLPDFYKKVRFVRFESPVDQPLDN
jgi:release factor glutamine methyltransferase